MIENYETVAETAKRWGIGTRAVIALCTRNRIPGATKFGKKMWMIPAGTPKPEDKRIKSTNKEGYWIENIHTSCGDCDLIEACLNDEKKCKTAVRTRTYSCSKCSHERKFDDTSSLPNFCENCGTRLIGIKDSKQN